MINPLPCPPGACDPRVIKYNAQHRKFLNLRLKNRRSEFVSIEGALTCFYSNDYSETACPAGYQQLTAGRIYFPPDPPSPTSLHQQHPKTTVMALVASAKIQRKCFFIDNQPTPQALTYHTPHLVYPLFITALLFVVSVKFHNSLKKEKGVGSRREGQSMEKQSWGCCEGAGGKGEGLG